MNHPYDHKKIERKWQQQWRKSKLYRSQENAKKPKCYVLDMFPYPSGEGLHVGHPKGYIATDVYSRFKRMQGYSVLHPTGFDAFGLPAENYAIANKVNPSVAVARNVEHFKEQLEQIGLDYDWSREINTTDPAYYKWTQWLFLQLYKAGLAYESHEPINWCPSCKTGLANEDVEDGRCERCGTLVEKKPIRQWVLKITDYAEKLLTGLEKLDWPESIKELQRNWIGKSEGSEIDFGIRGREEKIKVFTTRADTLFGATYVVLAPEHPLLEKLKPQISNWDETIRYIVQSQKRSEIERTAEEKEKTGVELKGVKAINPANKEEIPIFVADYVLASYGTGAIMAVPAHDERDFAFAKKYGLPVKHVIGPYLYDDPKEGFETERRDVATAIIKNPIDNTYLVLNWKTTDWKAFPSGGIDGGDWIETARREATEETGYKNLRFVCEIGDSTYGEFYRPHKKSNVYAHFRYFLFELENGERVFVDGHEKEQHEPVWIPEKEVSGHINVWNQQLAWKRYSVGDFPVIDDGILIHSGTFDGLPSEEARAKIARFVGGKIVTKYKLRDWVFSRQRYWGEPIPLIHCAKCGVVPVSEKELPVKLPKVAHYEPTGTGESPLAAISKWVNVKCPKCKGPGKRETNTMPQWAGSSWYYLRYMDPKNAKRFVGEKNEKYWAPVDYYVGGAEHATRHLIYARFWHRFLYDKKLVTTKEPFRKLQHVGLIMGEDGRKMSKRWGNVINPDDVIEKFGADSLRVYEMFMGPFDQAIAWNTDNLVGARRFLERVWRTKDKIKDKIPNAKNKELEIALHQTIKKVTEDILEFKFNTAISQLMIFTNLLDKQDDIPQALYEKFIVLLAPFAPHITEELWHRLGKRGSVHTASWPVFEEKILTTPEAVIAVQINGRTRGTILLSRDAGEADALKKALSEPSLKKWFDGKKTKKVVYVRAKILSIVTE